MRVLISGGGTGGHVYPALAVAAQLSAQIDQAPGQAQPAALPAHAAELNSTGITTPDTTTPDSLPASSNRAGRSRAHATALLWIGSQGGMEQMLVERHDVPFRAIRTGQLRGVNPLAAIANFIKMLNGVGESTAIIDEFKPQVCLVTGGYVCVPVVIACRRRGIPVLVYLPDMTPGWAIRWISKLAQRVAVSMPEAAPHFGGKYPQGKAVVTGYPVRAELIEAAQDRAAARRRLAHALDLPLSADTFPLLLVWGGSQGSRSINRATWAALAEILPHAHVLHVIGTRDWAMAQDPAENPAAIHLAGASAPTAQHQHTQNQLPAALSQRYHAVDYLHEAMTDALAAADLTVARAGASILGEFTVAGLPSVLVPLPIAGAHQLPNARQLAQAGAAQIIADETLQTTLGPTVSRLLQDPARRRAMAQAARTLARPDAAAAIAQELWSLAHPQQDQPAASLPALQQ